MKKIYYMLFLLLTGVCFNACVSEEEDLFDKSAAERMNEAIANYKAILQDAPNGWVMEFYPSDRSMGGYVYTAKFDNGKVDMASEVSLSSNSGESWPAGTVVSSQYRVISEQSVILTFDTYNLLFHFFSEPKGSSDTDGYASDYEFIFMESSADRLVLRGKKYGNTLVMTKLTESADSYIQKILDMQEKMDAVPRMKMIVSGKEYMVNMAGKLLSYTETKEDSSVENVEMSFIYTPDGINLYEPLTIDGVTFQRFVYDDATGVVKAVDADVTFPYPTALEQFCGTTTRWYFSFDINTVKGEMNQELMDIFKNSYDANLEIMNEHFVGWYLGANPGYPARDSNPHCMGWESNWLGIVDFQLCYSYNLSVIDEATKKVEIKSIAPGGNYEYYEYLDPVVEYVDKYSPYIVTFDDERLPKTAKMVSTVDDSVWFSVSKQ
ncbi:DUF4302 domain-containing protein [uncultured Bacteroides sp.]|uniref:DUF4302 domain-containing protein n=1 Tax=uncultured Bacteroides sp. TaxID=162156 RepID=UPI0026194EF6|nr:DUF4302 domain-containing protein [uncultured Bacteroides sp.]